MPVVQEDPRGRSSPRSPAPAFRGVLGQNEESSSSTGLEYSESSTVKRSRARDRELFSTVHRPYCKTSVTDSRKVSPRSTVSLRPADPVLRTLDPVSQTSNNSEACKNFNLVLYDGSPSSAPIGGGTIADSTCLTPSGYQMTDLVEHVDRLTASSLQPVHDLVITNGTTGNARYRMTAPPMPANSTRRMVDCKFQNVEAVDEKPEPLLAIEGPREVIVPDFTKSHQEPYVGLYNHGNTCYMSVIFQCLRFTPSFFDTCRLAQTDRMNPPRKLLQCIALLLDGMAQKASNKDLYSSVETIRVELGHVAPHFKGSDQQDALEFLLIVLDSLHSELKQSSTSTSPESSRTQTPTMIDNSSMPPLEHALRNNTNDSSLSSRPRLHNGGNTVPINITTVPPTCQPPVLTKKIGRGLSSLFRAHKKQGAKKLSGVILTTNSSPPVSGGELAVPSVTEGVHPKILAWDQENMRESSPIKDIFMGQLQTYRECQACGCETVSYEVVWNLSVPIPTDTLVNGTSPSPILDGDTGRRYGGSLHNTVDTKSHTNYSGPVVPKRLPPRSTPEINNPLFDGSSRQGGNTWPSRNINTNLLGDPHSSSVLGYRSLVGDRKARYQSNFYTPLVPCVPAPVTEAVPPRQVSLSQCLKAHTLTETLDGSDRPWCEKCQEKTPCLIQSSLSRLPDVLIIHLLRFHCDGRNSKNTVNVNFDMKLDMSEYMTSEYDKRHRFSAGHRDEGDRVFWLYAVVYHDGMMNYGHYTAACLTATVGDDQSVEKRWYLFDDEIVKEIKPELVNRSSAYLLFYERDSLHKQRLSAATREKCDTSSLSQNVTLSTRL
ncbi:ubiquitin carboxyl-terminal hydrolase 31 [Clonorchis sinensis]|uniref:Ubiquitin carboxyl-terminal hydrolase n=1 Tax=Clonorchis sinensis TaxID=79923 RepID=H2KNF0_CLOSI|nr:ubiquitin carboxyl-terminal hydrolase 31 [Clonorchis sinensis]